MISLLRRLFARKKKTQAPGLMPACRVATKPKHVRDLMIGESGWCNKVALDMGVNRRCFLWQDAVVVSEIDCMNRVFVKKTFSGWVIDISACEAEVRWVPKSAPVGDEVLVVIDRPYGV